MDTNYNVLCQLVPVVDTRLLSFEITESASEQSDLLYNKGLSFVSVGSAVQNAAVLKSLSQGF
jgi:hypothetical protein